MVKSPRNDIPYGSSVMLDGRRGKFLIRRETGESVFLPEGGETEALSADQIARMTLVGADVRARVGQALSVTPAVASVPDAAPRRPVPPNAMPVIHVTESGQPQIGLLIFRYRPGYRDGDLTAQPLFFPSPDRETPEVVPQPVTLTFDQYRKLGLLPYERKKKPGTSPSPAAEPAPPVELTEGEQAALEFIRRPDPFLASLPKLDAAAAERLMEGGLLSAREKTALFEQRDQVDRYLDRKDAATREVLAGADPISSLISRNRERDERVQAYLDARIGQVIRLGGGIADEYAIVRDPGTGRATLRLVDKPNQVAWLRSQGREPNTTIVPFNNLPTNYLDQLRAMAVPVTPGGFSLRGTLRRIFRFGRSGEPSTSA